MNQNVNTVIIVIMTPTKTAEQQSTIAAASPLLKDLTAKHTEYRMCSSDDKANNHNYYKMHMYTYLCNVCTQLY